MPRRERTPERGEHPRKRIRGGPTFGSGHGVSATIEIGLPLICIGALILVIALTQGLSWGYLVGGALAALGLSFAMRGGTI